MGSYAHMQTIRLHVKLWLLLLLLLGSPFLSGQEKMVEQAITEELAPSVAYRKALPESRSLSLRGWQLRRYEENPVMTKLLPLQDEDSKQVIGLELPVDVSETQDFFLKDVSSLWGYDELTYLIEVPEACPKDLDAYIFIKDWDDQWFHIRFPAFSQFVEGSHQVKLTVPLYGPETKKWKASGHFRNWHVLLTDRIKEIGLKFDLPSGECTPVTLTLTSITATKVADYTFPAPALKELRVMPYSPQAGDDIEVSFEATHRFRNPFSSDDVNLTASIEDPSGMTTQHRLFYYEPFAYDSHRQRRNLQTPIGKPRFMLRFTPLKEGAHTVHISGMLGGEAVALPDLSFDVHPAKEDWPGYVQVSEKDHTLLSWTHREEELFAAGLNVRSPYDTRYEKSFGATDWDYFDFDMYEDLIPKYAANNIQVMEVWMSAWWLSMEWIPDDLGNHGLGHMNQWRAWKLDRLFALAEKYNLYIVLVINNHGRFSTWCDKEWERNPWNKTQGGPYDLPNSYFSEAEAHLSFMSMMNYVIARYAYSPNLLAWKLFTEINLTGDNHNWYHSDAMRRWHAMASAHVKENDPYQHLVTTHWSNDYGKVNMPVAALPNIDLITMDIYYDRSKDIQRFFKVLGETSDFNQKLPKPGVVTEFGGKPQGDRLPYLYKGHHLGLWGSYFAKYPLTPFYWWFPMVEEKDMYPAYKALYAFTSGEDRTGMKVTRFKLASGYTCFMLYDDEKAMCWVMSDDYYLRSESMVDQHVEEGLSLKLAELSEGTWVADFFETGAGSQTGSAEFAVDSAGKGVMELPAFDNDIAIKLKKRSQ